MAGPEAERGGKTAVGLAEGDLLLSTQVSRSWYPMADKKSGHALAEVEGEYPCRMQDQRLTVQISETSASELARSSPSDWKIAPGCRSQSRRYSHLKTARSVVRRYRKRRPICGEAPVERSMLRLAAFLLMLVTSVHAATVGGLSSWELNTASNVIKNNDVSEFL